MRKYRMAIGFFAIVCLLVSGLAGSSARVIPAGVSENEKQVWGLERDYWRYVQSNDLTAYLGLWHKDFLGWPSVNPVPIHKDHITDWITSQTSKGMKFRLGVFKPAGIQFMGDLAVVFYWVRFAWEDNDGKGADSTLRVTHTWVKTDKGWQILGGMSGREPMAGN